MTSIEKFIFARNFAAAIGGEPSPVAPSVPPLVYSEDDMAEARADARAEGLAQGREQGLAEARDGLERRVAETLERLAERLDDAMAQREDIACAAERDAFALTAAALRKALPALHRNFAAAEIEAMAVELSQRLVNAPALTIAVHPAVVAGIGERLSVAAAGRAAEARFAVVAEPALIEGDCTIAWSGGGAERRLAALLAGIDEIVTTLTGSPSHPVNPRGLGSMEYND